MHGRLRKGTLWAGGTETLPINKRDETGQRPWHQKNGLVATRVFSAGLMVLGGTEEIGGEMKGGNTTKQRNLIQGIIKKR